MVLWVLWGLNLVTLVWLYLQLNKLKRVSDDLSHLRKEALVRLETYNWYVDLNRDKREELIERWRLYSELSKTPLPLMDFLINQKKEVKGD